MSAFPGTREELYALAYAEPSDVQPEAQARAVGRPLVPPGFVPLPVRPGNYVQRHPTRYHWRDGVAAQIRRVYARFPNVHVNTYVDHPEGYGRDIDSFDV